MPDWRLHRSPAARRASSSADHRSITAISAFMIQQPPTPISPPAHTLAVLSNRISYVFDLHGPSFTIDTACSSSLVALDAAVARSKADASTPPSSAAPILWSALLGSSVSRKPQCCRRRDCARLFRQELTVMCAPKAASSLSSAHSIAHKRTPIASMPQSWLRGVNSDGRTSGISLPSKAHQIALLERVYGNSGVDPNDVAFVEAHGTGTRVGDPAEAGAIGEVLGQRRSLPLPIGSIKTNIGHTEPASGLAGAMKAMLALEHNEFPRTLHCDELNPDIAFDDLNLSVCADPAGLPRDGRIRYAGVSSFGFGGTNAHVILADPPSTKRREASRGASRAPQFLMLSAQSQDALADLARRYSSRLAGLEPEPFRQVAAATGRRRERHSERLVIPLTTQKAAIEALDKAADKIADPSDALIGTAIERTGPVAFVFSGNGSQWPGMGQRAYEANAVSAIVSMRSTRFLTNSPAGRSPRSCLIPTLPRIFIKQASLSPGFRYPGGDRPLPDQAWTCSIDGPWTQHGRGCGGGDCRHPRP